MSAERGFKKQCFEVQVRSANWDTPALVDQIGKGLLDHLIECQTCSQVFAAQIHSLEKAGCAKGRQIVSLSKVKGQERRSALALGHFAGDGLDDYLFDRLGCEEASALEHHARLCSQCAKEISEREILIDFLKTAFREQQGNVKGCVAGFVLSDAVSFKGLK